MKSSKRRAVGIVCFSSALLPCSFLAMPPAVYGQDNGIFNKIMITRDRNRADLDRIMQKGRQQKAEEQERHQQQQTEEQERLQMKQEREERKTVERNRAAQPDVASQAMLSLAISYAASGRQDICDQKLRMLIEKYPATPAADTARRRLGLPARPTATTRLVAEVALVDSSDVPPVTPADVAARRAQLLKAAVSEVDEAEIAKVQKLYDMLPPEAKTQDSRIGSKLTKLRLDRDARLAKVGALTDASIAATLLAERQVQAAKQAGEAADAQRDAEEKVAVARRNAEEHAARHALARQRGAALLAGAEKGDPKTMFALGESLLNGAATLDDSVDGET